MINQNSSVDTTRERASASAYHLIEVSIKSAGGRIFNIMHLVTGITVTESVYNLAMTAEVEVRDTVNLFEEMRISGQEIVKLSFTVQDMGGEKKNVIKEFLVSEVPLYGKVNSSTQAYTLKLISLHGIINQVSRISRSGQGSIVSQIERILKNDLQYPGKIIVEAESKGNVKLIYPNMRPFATIEWLQRRAFDETGSPIFVYESWDGMHIKSYSEMCVSNLVGSYGVSFTQGVNATSKEGMKEEKYRIKSLASNMNSSKLAQANSGAWASKTRVLDYATKKYYDVIYDYGKTHSSFVKADQSKTKNSLISSQFLIKGLPLNEHADASVFYLNQNSLALGTSEEDVGNYHTPALQTIGAFKSITETIDNNKQTMSINGNLDITPGSKVFVKAPKSVSAETWKNAKSGSQADKGALSDMMISGPYITMSIVHNFKEEYTQQVLIKRDYSNYSFG